PARLVPQPMNNGATASTSDHESSEAQAAPERGQIKAASLTETAPQAHKIPLTQAIKAVATNAVASTPRVSVETDGPAIINLGRRANYTIQLRNDEPTRIDRLVLEVTVPAGAEFVESDPKPASAEDDLEYHLCDIEPGSTRTLRLVLIPRQRG